MSVRQYWEAVANGDRQGPAAAVFAAALRCVSAGSWLGLQANLAVYRLGLRSLVHLERPAIVVGNLTLGGTGKTTTTRFVVERLAATGLRAGVILRGYGRCSGGRPLLVSDGETVLATPEEAGDEAVMLASLLPGHPVAVGVRREAVGRLLLDKTGADALVLDDGFQYFRLARDADIVLVDASHPIESDRLFPAGRLREPHSHLRRATQVWLTHAELVDEPRLAELRAWVGEHAPGVPVVVTEHRPTGIRSLDGGPPPPDGARVIAVSALGNPASFEEGLAGLGYQVTPVRMPDHHSYTDADWSAVRERAEAAASEHVVTTEKDAVKLRALPFSRPRLHILGCRLEIRADAGAVDDLIEATRRWVPAGSTRPGER